jgi:hypothetical protein
MGGFECVTVLKRLWEIAERIGTRGPMRETG